jgi:hypothetical protein
MPVPLDELLLEPLTESDALLAVELALSDTMDVAELAAWALTTLRQVNRAKDAVPIICLFMVLRWWGKMLPILLRRHPKRRGTGVVLAPKTVLESEFEPFN